MIVRRGSAPIEDGGDEGVGSRSRQRISDAGALTQFGAHVDTLMPGSSSSDRHWHEEEDELLYMLEGEATDGATVRALWNQCRAMTSRATGALREGPTRLVGDLPSFDHEALALERREHPSIAEALRFSPPAVGEAEEILGRRLRFVIRANRLA